MEKCTMETKPKELDYQLTNFMNEEQLKPFIKPFTKYNEEDKAVIVEVEGKVALFTAGSKIDKTNYLKRD